MTNEQVKYPRTPHLPHSPGIMGRSEDNWNDKYLLPFALTMSIEDRWVLVEMGVFSARKLQLSLTSKPKMDNSQLRESVARVVKRLREFAEDKEWFSAPISRS